MKGYILFEYNGISGIFYDKDKLIYDLEAIDILNDEFKVYDFDGYRYEFVIEKREKKLFMDFIITKTEIIANIIKGNNENKKLKQLLCANLVLDNNIQIDIDLNELTLDKLLRKAIHFYGVD